MRALGIAPVRGPGRPPRHPLLGKSGLRQLRVASDKNLSYAQVARRLNEDLASRGLPAVVSAEAVRSAYRRHGLQPPRLKGKGAGA